MRASVRNGHLEVVNNFGKTLWYNVLSVVSDGVSDDLGNFH